MTSEEKCLIVDCRILAIDATDFKDKVKTELIKSGFMSINIVLSSDGQTGIGTVDMVIEYVGEVYDSIKEEVKIPIIYPFDFVEGAGAIVIMPGDDN